MMSLKRALRWHVFCQRRYLHHKKAETISSRSLEITDHSYRRCVNEKLSLFAYTIIEDDFKRLARSSKVAFSGLTAFLIVPGGFALFTTPSHVVSELILHGFKISSVTLSWMSASVLAFRMMGFGTSFVSVACSMVGLIGSSLSLIVRDYSTRYGYICLLFSYICFALANNPYALQLSFRRNAGTYRALEAFTLPVKGSLTLPTCIAKPITWMSLLNIALLITTAVRQHYVDQELCVTSHEEFIKHYEAKHHITAENGAKAPL